MSTASTMAEPGRRTVVPAMSAVLAVAALAVVLVTRRDALDAIDGVTAAQFALVLALTVVGHWLNALEFHRISHALGARQLRVTENWLLFCSGQLINHLPAQAGTLYRFRYMNKVHGLDYPTVVAGHAFNFALTVLATGVIGSAALVVLAVRGGGGSAVLTAGFGALACIGVVAAVAPLRESRRNGRGATAWNRLVRGWATVRQQPAVGAGVAGLELVKYLVAGWRLQLVFGWVGMDGPYAFFVVLATVAGLATFVGVTPAAIGFREFGLSGAAAALGRGFDDGLVAASLDRAALLVAVVVLGTIGMVMTTMRMSRPVSAPAAAPPPMGRRLPQA